LKADRSNRRRAARRHFTRRAVFFIGAFIGPANPTACAAPPLSCATICSGASFTAWFCPLGEIDDRLGRGRRVAAKRKPVVCNGSKAALTAPKSNFRFTPESGLNSDIAGGPFGADTVAKVENRTTLKISRKLIFGLLCCCVAF
jgi:hypothetical protein